MDVVRLKQLIVFDTGFRVSDRELPVKAGQYYEYWMDEYSELYVSPQGSGGYLLACFNLRIFGLVIRYAAKLQLNGYAYAPLQLQVAHAR
jgi:hypothetical protein